ncbi:hypothetical protein C2E23DRAFT_24947 [Lenzites betulinus]|nr:hypothetical protein C2E23DRAFT_24947 [Lenzites betulinus]
MYRGGQVQPGDRALLQLYRPCVTVRVVRATNCKNTPAPQHMHMHTHPARSSHRGTAPAREGGGIEIVARARWAMEHTRCGSREQSTRACARLAGCARAPSAHVTRPRGSCRRRTILSLRAPSTFSDASSATPRACTRSSPRTTRARAPRGFAICTFVRTARSCTPPTRGTGNTRPPAHRDRPTSSKQAGERAATHLSSESKLGPAAGLERPSRSGGARPCHICPNDGARACACSAGGRSRSSQQRLRAADVETSTSFFAPIAIPIESPIRSHSHTLVIACLPLRVAIAY